MVLLSGACDRGGILYIILASLAAGLSFVSGHKILLWPIVAPRWGIRRNLSGNTVDFVKQPDTFRKIPKS